MQKVEHSQQNGSKLWIKTPGSKVKSRHWIGLSQQIEKDMQAIVCPAEHTKYRASCNSWSQQFMTGSLTGFGGAEGLLLGNLNVTGDNCPIGIVSNMEGSFF